MTATSDGTNDVSYFAEGSASACIGITRASELIRQMLAALAPLRRVLLIPPDFTRRSSGAGELTVLCSIQPDGLPGCPILDYTYRNTETSKMSLDCSPQFFSGLQFVNA